MPESPLEYKELSKIIVKNPPKIINVHSENDSKRILAINKVNENQMNPKRLQLEPERKDKTGKKAESINEKEVLPTPNKIIPLEPENARNVEHASGDTGERSSNPEEEKVASVKSYFSRLYDELHKKDPQSFEHIRQYKSDKYFSDINRVARMGKDKFIDWLRSMDIPDSEVSARALEASVILAGLENFIQESVLPQDLTVYRKVSDATLQLIRDGNGSFVDNGLVSTCFTLEDARKYHYKLRTIKIEIPKGTRVIDMTSALRFTNWTSSSLWENELVIGRGYSYGVTEEKTDDYELVLKIPKTDKNNEAAD